MTEVSRAPQLTQLSREMYPEGSIGSEFFPEVLEGRRRPPLVARTIPLDRAYGRYLKDEGIYDFEGLMKTDESIMQDMSGNSRAGLMRGIAHYVDGVIDRNVTTPYGRLLGAVLGGEQGPIPINDEYRLQDEFIRLFMSWNVSGMTEAVVVERHFGLNTWTPLRTAREVAASLEMGMTPRSVQANEQNAFSRIKHAVKHERTQLRRFHAFPHGSLARAIGIDYRQEVPKTATANELKLDPKLLATIDPYNMLGGDTRVVKLSELLEAKVYRKVSDEQKTFFAQRVGELIAKD